MEENKFLKQAKEELAYLSGDPDFQRLVESRAGMLMDIDCYKEQCRQEALIEGRAEGRAEGERKNQEQTALDMLRDNMDIQLIMKYTHLSADRIAELAQKL